MKQTIYKCDLCSNESQENDISGVSFSDGGLSIVSAVAVDMLHICHDCLDQIAQNWETTGLIDCDDDK